MKRRTPERRLAELEERVTRLSADRAEWMMRTAVLCDLMAKAYRAEGMAVPEALLHDDHSRRRAGARPRLRLVDGGAS